jgi:hypothetical protein
MVLGHFQKLGSVAQGRLPAALFLVADVQADFAQQR